MGRHTFSTLAAAGAALASGAECVPVEWTDSNMAASSSLTSSVSYVHSGNGHWYFGIVVLCVAGRSFVFFCCPRCRCFAPSSWCREYGENKMAVEVM